MPPPNGQAKIEKLSILGIRSFDHRRPMSIEFHSPLTLIVGMNGSGKTTIIECLKYGTTGLMPPGSVGSAFVHDPQMAGEKEVMAQVKIQFTATDNSKMVCTRNMQLTVTKAKSTFKTLDATILMKKLGERNVISSRVFEIDTMMPRFLGVSKAVLESVIFCHQEESLWPMSAPKILKERFDLIFEALKYTKAIDNIKVMQKNKKLELIQLKANEDVAKVANTRAKESKQKLEALTTEIADLKSQTAEFMRQEKEARIKYEEICKLIGENELIVGQLRGKRIEQQTKEESVQSLRDNIQEMTESDEELNLMLQEYDGRVGTYETDRDAKRDRYHEIAEDLQSTRNRRIVRERECGSYEAQKESYDRQVEGRKRLVKETARSFDIRGFDLDIDDSQAKAFMERIGQMSQNHQAEFERARAELQDKLSERQKELNRINERKSALSQAKSTSRTTISNYDRKIDAIRTQRSEINIDEGGRAALQSQLQEKQSHLRVARSDLEKAGWDAKIEADNIEMRRLEDLREKLDAESTDASRRGNETAQLDLLQKEVNDLQRSLDTMTSSHGEKLTKLLGSSWSPASIERDFSRALSAKEDELDEAKKQRDGANNELQLINSRLVERQAEVNKAEKDRAAAAVAIKNVTQAEPDGYLKKIRSLEAERDEAMTDAESFEQIMEYLDSCIAEARKTNACKTCLRGFKDAAAVDRMVKNVEVMKQRRQSPEDVKYAQEALREVETNLQACKGVSAKFEEWERLGKELPAKRAAVAKLEEQRSELVNRLEARDNVFDEQNSRKREVADIQRTIQKIGSYVTDLEKKHVQIQELAERQKESGSSRGVEAIQLEIKKNSEEHKSIRSRIAEASKQQTRTTSKISSLQLDISNTQGKLSTADYELREKKSLDAQEEEYKKLGTDERENIRKYEKELQDLSTELSTAQAKYDDVSRSSAVRDRELQDRSSKLDKSINKLRMAEQEIQAYHDRDGEGQLRRGREDVAKLNAEEARLESEQNNVAREIKKAEDQLRSHSEMRRSIVDNQRYRRDRRQLKKVRDEIEELERTNAEDDKIRNERRANTWAMRRNEIAAKHAGLVGQIKSKDDQVVKGIEEYDTLYKHAAREYTSAHVMVETTKAAIEDLARYGGALDKAIMKYHQMKMEEINGTIEDLWRKTYQGTDIDSIRIRSEHETVKANKSYNYRVVMMKEDVELDMRGRCSAGQKVLASIIIRMALADCFGSHCGIIALDEPTTNLDSENIRALATSLSEIIKTRRSQKNFQLVVITHDEEFLRHMSSSDYTDDYFRVYRDDSQLSVIEKQSIAEVI